MKTETKTLSEDGVGDVDVRQQMSLFGKGFPLPIYNGLQAVITTITGKPYLGQQPLVKLTPLFHLFIASASLIGGVASSAIICQSPPIFWPLLTFSYVLTVGGARNIQVTINHRCIHKQMFGNAWDQILAEILSTVLLIQDHDGYQSDHKALHHHRKIFATKQDPDFAFLIKLGFVPGLKNPKD